ncbi:MAG: glycogen-binding domain-containing protein [Pseudomonadota bacterium]
MKAEERTARITRFLLNEMPADERRAFLKELERDASLAEEMEFARTLMASARELPALEPGPEFLGSLSLRLARDAQKEQTRTRRFGYPAFGLVSAAAAACIAVVLWMKPGDRADSPVTTTFQVDAPNAGSVELVGDFNLWTAGKTRMVREANASVWKASVQLPPGRHYFQYVVDGKRIPDPSLPSVDDDFGGEDSYVDVTEDRP